MRFCSDEQHASAPDEKQSKHLRLMSVTCWKPRRLRVHFRVKRVGIFPRLFEIVITTASGKIMKRISMDVQWSGAQISTHPFEPLQIYLKGTRFCLYNPQDPIILPVHGKSSDYGAKAFSERCWGTLVRRYDKHPTHHYLIRLDPLFMSPVLWSVVLDYALVPC